MQIWQRQGLLKEKTVHFQLTFVAQKRQLTQTSKPSLYSFAIPKAKVFCKNVKLVAERRMTLRVKKLRESLNRT